MKQYRKYFGTDGIRGIVGSCNMNHDFVFRVGYAAGIFFSEKINKNKECFVVTGMDTRSSSPMISSAIKAGLLAAGVNIFDVSLDAIPTPAIAYLVKYFNADAGIVVSASHNPYNYNGIKFFSSLGTKLSEEDESNIELYIEKPALYANREKFGKISLISNAEDLYLKFCKSAFLNNVDLYGFKIVIDSANGAAYRIAPSLFRDLGAKVFSMGSEPDGININDKSGSSFSELLVKEVRRTKSHLGIAFDGDADRVQMVDHNGHVFNGDELLYMIIIDRMRSCKVEGVVGTHMTNYGFELAMSRLGVKFDRANVGDRSVYEKMCRRGWIYGGESSGHLLCLDRHTTGDGIIAALQVLSAMVNCRTKKLSDLLKDVYMYPQIITNIDWDLSQDWRDCSSLVDSYNRAKDLLVGNGRVLIRKSGTEPVLRIMVEAKSIDIAKECSWDIVSSIHI
ncbi:phosphoglucosamine mutase [Candidatus Kinetoplastibacterium blastocrithidii TCC012E]|uniref:Phosphoglucosamine mutase n=1 Tax=Candidatus Kinetoplastidibacterium blastocrithidiae TCC012E TaxID=1208922 RepID=M1MCT1_9PROT|nr:phosphoglucosamine mutase [Candidatus Kinetoplastibacterium blastocrithidii]AFZ83498.1 phosphoglucosamine mutase [Candidatus Kinetoplastibacterium blastocrithidii (ex Strigomonas culicis)]AGF49595.1 phosphoglucosamine mutase [Candidatus Kinetoplastibacterium blastocrithidii TCC012E]